MQINKRTSLGELAHTVNGLGPITVTTLII